MGREQGVCCVRKRERARCTTYLCAALGVEKGVTAAAPTLTDWLLLLAQESLNKDNHLFPYCVNTSSQILDVRTLKKSQDPVIAQMYINKSKKVRVGKM